MLLPAQVIPFLGHEDHFVRDHAGRYFYDAHDVTPLTADAVWEAIDRLDPQESAARLVALLGRLPQSDASTERLLTAFDVDKLCDVEEDLWDAVHDIDFEQLRRHRARILALPNLPDDVGEHLSARLELAEAPPETLWDRLLAHIDATRGKYWDQIDHAESDRAVEALARHGEPVAARATQWLESPVLTPGQEGRGGADDDTSIYAVQLLGRMRYRPALDLLLKTLVECDEENDVLHEQLMAAIPRVGGADAVAPIEAEFPRQGQAYRLYAAGLLGRIKHPAAEAAVVRLIEDPALSAARTELGIALAELCPTDGLSALKRLVLDGDYDPYMAELKGDLVACALMADFNFPELGALREEVIAKEIESDRRMEALASRMLDGNGPDDHFDEYEDDAPAHPALPAELDDRYPPVVAPIRTEPKVGRNDPCPCGSGKKYKKCCLDKSA